MADDTSIKDLFDHAKQGPEGPAEFPQQPTVTVTYVEHSPRENRRSGRDIVLYADGPLKLSGDQRSLRGEFVLHHNDFESAGDLKSGLHTHAFVARNQDTMAITVSDSGQATIQRKLNGTNFLGRPARQLKATYEKGMFVEKGGDAARSLSFTLGSRPVS